MKRKFKVSFVWLFLSLLCSGCWSAKEDAAKLQEVRSVWARLPSYPGMQEIDSKTESGYGKALVSKKFRSDARYDEVRRFYVESLGRDGWEIYGEKQLKGFGSNFGGYEIRFLKSDLSIVIEYAGDKADYGWQYGIAVSWSRWVKDKRVRE